MTKWIKCNNRLPESPKQGTIDVIIASYSVERKIFHIGFAEFQKGRFYNKYNEYLPVDDPYWPITHWADLPAAPEELKDE